MAHSFGLILANRGVVLGAVKASDLLALAVEAERAGVVDAVWVGDSLLAKPRLESVTLLSALAAATSTVRLGVGCMATFVHRHPVLLAQQWASLDVLSNGRAWLALCLGGAGGGPPPGGGGAGGGGPGGGGGGRPRGGARRPPAGAAPPPRGGPTPMTACSAA